MSFQKSAILIIEFVLLITLPCCSDKRKASGVNIAASANTQYAMEALVEQFENETGISCELIIGSSGMLTAQIIQGAPYDIFVSADMKYPREIYNAGLALAPPVSYGHGQLVLWTTVSGIEPSLAMLKDNSVEHIALANPKTAPYGKAAVEVLNYYELLEYLDHKLVYGESIAQTNQFITSKSAELGFTAMSVVMSPEIKDKGRWMALSNTTYSPIQQGAVMIKRGQSDSDAQRKFYEYLLSEKAKILLKNFGYLEDE